MASTLGNVTPKHLTAKEIEKLLETSKAWNLEALRFLVEQDMIDETHEKFNVAQALYDSHKKHGDLKPAALVILGKIILRPDIKQLLVKVAHSRLSMYKSSFENVATDTDRLSTDEGKYDSALEALLAAANRSNWR